MLFFWNIIHFISNSNIFVKIIGNVFFLFLYQVCIDSCISWSTPWNDDPIHANFYNALSSNVEYFLDNQVSATNNIFETYDANCVLKYPEPPSKKIFSEESLPDICYLNGNEENLASFHKFLSSDKLNIIVVNYIKFYDNGVYIDIDGICVQNTETDEYYIVLSLIKAIDYALIHEIGHRAGLEHITGDEDNVMDDDGGYTLRSANPNQIGVFQDLFALLD